MEKKSLAFSVIVLSVLFAARSARADSIRLSDLKLDSSAGFSISHALDAGVAPNLLGGDSSLHSLISSELPVFAGALRGTGEDEISLRSDGAPGWPVASHLVRGVETGGLGSKSEDSGPTSVPEPASALLAGLGILGLCLFAITSRNRPPLPPISF